MVYSVYQIAPILDRMERGSLRASPGCRAGVGLVGGQGLLQGAWSSPLAVKFRPSAGQARPSPGGQEASGGNKPPGLPTLRASECFLAAILYPGLLPPAGSCPSRCANSRVLSRFGKDLGELSRPLSGLTPLSATEWMKEGMKELPFCGLGLLQDACTLLCL